MNNKQRKVLQDQLRIVNGLFARYKMDKTKDSETILEGELFSLSDLILEMKNGTT